AIHDLLKRTERILAEYEEKLGLVQRFWTDREKLMEVQTLLEGLKKEDFTNSAAWERHCQMRIMFEDVSKNITAV
ncbi:MAG TPA: hypothetical protein DEF89_17405, partial [Desulfosporosinus sp.]|nr:hypothetical protein [Desulfosporosinus sp.]